eukprot:859844-Prorocentrum_minimum.AAC.1
MLTIKTLLSHLITREFNSPANSSLDQTTPSPHAIGSGSRYTPSPLASSAVCVRCRRVCRLRRGRGAEGGAPPAERAGASGVGWADRRRRVGGDPLVG